MHAMILNKLRTPLEWTELPDRPPGPGQIRVKVSACGVCRTDLHVVDGELPAPQVPIIPGHEIVGRIDAMGLVCAGIHMSDIPRFPYAILWEEREVLSVANLTRQDGIDFLRLAPEMSLVTRTTPYPLHKANEALADLRGGRFDGAAVLVP